MTAILVQHRHLAQRVGDEMDEHEMFVLATRDFVHADASGRLQSLFRAITVRQHDHRGRNSQNFLVLFAAHLHARVDAPPGELNAFHLVASRVHAGFANGFRHGRVETFA